MDAIPARPFRIDDVTVDPAMERLTDAEGRVVPLRRQSFAVLLTLAAHPERVVSRDELMAAVWPGIAVTDDSLVQCVADIRRALGPAARHLRTVPRRGYQLTLTGSGQGADGEGAGERGAWWRRRTVLGGALAGALLLALLVAAPFFGRAGQVSRGAPAVAVLPFDDMSPGGGQQYLGDGVADEIITMLARAPLLSVVARNSSFAYRGSATDVRQVGRDLGVAYVLEGSVRRESDGLRIIAQLVETATGHHVWAQRFDRTGADPSGLTDEVALRIVADIAGDRGAVRMAEYAAAWGRDRAELGEYDYATRAWGVMMGDQSAAGNTRADAIIREGLARFPDSTHLKIKLAWNDWRRAYCFWSLDMAADFASAGRLAREVLATPNLAPSVARAAHSLLGYVLMREGDYAGVRREAGIVEAMGEHDPAQLTDLAETLVPAGDYDRARRFIEFGMALNPADADYQHGLLAWTLRLQGRLEESARESEKANVLWPYQRLQYAITLSRLGRAEEARAQVAKAVAEDPDFSLADWRVATFYADPTLMPRELDELRVAGLPE